VVTDGFVGHYSAVPEPVRGIAGFRELIQMTLVAEWVVSDDLAMSRQIGALPAAGSAGEKVAQKLFALPAARMRRRA
jgi:hypothetical protein